MENLQDTPCRVSTDPNQSLMDVITTLAGGNIGAVSVLVQWCERDPLALLGMLGLDLKHLYDDHIWDVYKLCGQDIDRFVYHIGMELPNQNTGQHSISGPYASEVDTKEFCAKRTFGRPGSFWALEHPPVETDYAYPIR